MEDVLKIDTSEQLLTFQSKPLLNQFNLEEYNIQKEATLFLTGQIQGGASTRKRSAGRPLGDITNTNCRIHRKPNCKKFHLACRSCDPTENCEGCLQMRSSGKKSGSGRPSGSAK